MLNVGILGCGRIGQVHAQSLRTLDTARLVAVSDAVPEAAGALANRTDAEAREATALVESPDVDAIIICTSTDSHYDLIHAGARSGKAIFCEKPVDLSADRIRECIKVVKDSGIAFLTGFNRRFDPNFAHLQGRIRAGDIGAVEIVTIQSRDPSPPPIDYISRSGGLFRDMMIHDFDMARFLLGEEPVEIYAVGSSLVDPAIGAAGDVDTAAVTLTTQSEKICQITNSRRAAYGYDQRVEVHGSKGLLRAENVLESTVEIANEAGFRRAPAQHFFLERYQAAYLSEMAHFVESVTSGKTPSPGIVDGLQAQILADKATESMKSGKVLRI